MSARLRPSTASAIISQRSASHHQQTGGASIRLKSASSTRTTTAADTARSDATGAKNGVGGSASSNNNNKDLPTDPAVVQEEIKRLEERIALLEVEGRSSYERMSAEQRTLKEEINRFRNENKEMKATVAMAKRAGGGGNVIDSEIKQLDAAICSTTLKLDRINDTCNSLIQKLKDQESVMNDIDKNSRPILVEGSALDKKIRALENRLDKSLIKYNEAVAIRKTYQQILKRLKEEQVGFDNQLAAIEKTLSAKSHDYQELLAMSQQANAAKEAAKKELQDFQQAYAAERIAKDDQLAKKKAYVQLKADQTFKLERREKLLRQKDAEAARAEAEEERAQQQAALLGVGGRGGAGGSRTNTDHSGKEDEEERLAQYEAAFKTIKDATGVGDVNELIQKFTDQEDTRRHLQASVQDSQSRISRLESEIDELSAKLEELRYSGSGQIGSRRIVEEFEVHLSETKQLTQSNSAKYENITKLLIAARAGIEHLMEITQAYKNRLPTTTTTTGDENNNNNNNVAPLPDVTVVDDDTAVEALKVVEQKMAALMEEVVLPSSSNNAGLLAASPLSPHALGSVGGGGGNQLDVYGANASGNNGIGGGGSGPYELPAYNTRIRLPQADEAINSPSYGSGGDVFGADDLDLLDDPNDDAVLRREQVKKISINAIQREAKKLKRRRK